ncbi:MAG: radical SAM protein [Oscillospiraceae bacterium]|nr:radical SAM protein [Oscillospiraceae bacterium]
MFKRIYVEITNVCNLACSFCPGTQRTPRFMSAQEFRTLTSKLKTHTDYLYLHVMGEPLLHPALEEILAIASELDFRVCLTTNGTLLAEKAETLLGAPCLHKVSVSLHSFEGNDRQDDLTDYVDGVLAFCRCAAVRGVICALRLWNEGGENRRNGEIERLLSTRFHTDVTALRRDPNGSRKLAENIYLESAEKFDWPDPAAPDRRTQFCHALRQQVAVLCDGTVVPCCLDGEGRISLGNLFTQELDEILASPRAQAMRRGFEKRQPCEELCRRCGYAARFNR